MNVKKVLKIELEQTFTLSLWITTTNTHYVVSTDARFYTERHDLIIQELLADQSGKMYVSFGSCLVLCTHTYLKLPCCPKNSGLSFSLLTPFLTIHGKS